MLNSFIVNSIDTFNIVYLWIALTKKQKNIFKLLFSVLIISVVTTVIEQFNINFIVTYIMAIVILKIIYKRYLKDVIVEFLLIALIDMILQLMISLIINKVTYSYTIRGITIELIIGILVIVFSKSNLCNIVVFEKIDNNILVYLILTYSIYAVVFKSVWNYDNKIILNNLLITTAIFSSLVIIQILMYFYIVKMIREKEKLRISNEYNTVINEIVQEIKQRQHDFINYKNTIRGIVEVLDEKEVKNAISTYIKDEDFYDNKINELIYIDNVVIRSIIYRNMCKAKKRNVNLEYKIENDVLDNILNYQEMSNLLNNLLNNAFDEVSKKGCLKKNIEIKILIQDKAPHLIIKNQIENSNNLNLNEMFKRGYSTKDAAIRGYGLYNVQAIVNSHKGYIKINVECREIIFDIYFKSSLGKSGSP